MRRQPVRRGADALPLTLALSQCGHSTCQPKPDRHEHRNAKRSTVTIAGAAGRMPQRGKHRTDGNDERRMDGRAADL